MKKVNFICVKWGDKYDSSYVNRLYSMVKHNYTLPFDFFCYTENSDELNSEINVLQLEENSLQGWWHKLSLFKKDFFGLSGDLIYLDLDIIVTGNIDFLGEKSGDFLIIRDWKRKTVWNSSVMRFEVGKFSYIWDKFEQNMEYILEHYRGDQDWIFECTPEASIWPKNLIVSYKKSLKSKAFQLLQIFGKNKCWIKAFKWMDTPLPEDVRIVVFHGKPDPEDVADHPYGCWKRASFIKKYWH